MSAKNRYAVVWCISPDRWYHINTSVHALNKTIGIKPENILALSYKSIELGDRQSSPSSNTFYSYTISFLKKLQNLDIEEIIFYIHSHGTREGLIYGEQASCKIEYIDLLEMFVDLFKDQCMPLVKNTTIIMEYCYSGQFLKTPGIPKLRTFKTPKIAIFTSSSAEFPTTANVVGLGYLTPFVRCWWELKKQKQDSYFCFQDKNDVTKFITYLQWS